MNAQNLVIGEEYYSTRLNERVTFKYFYGGYAVVEDEQGNTINTTPDNLRPIQWSADEIMKREG